MVFDQLGFSEDIGRIYHFCIFWLSPEQYRPGADDDYATPQWLSAVCISLMDILGNGGLCESSPLESQLEIHTKQSADIQQAKTAEGQNRMIETESSLETWNSVTPEHENELQK